METTQRSQNRSIRLSVTWSAGFQYSHKQLHLFLFQVLKGGQEAPTKPKGRPKKNSIPTSEEIEAEEKLSSQTQPEVLKENQAEEDCGLTKEQLGSSSETYGSPKHIAEASLGLTTSS